jgi:hypothetical protein
MAYLFLDESGRFEGKSKSRSVVGGFFIADDAIPDDLKTFFTNFNLQSETFHACTIKDKELYTNIIDSLIDLCKKKNIIPLIFIPQRGFFIIDDVITYLNVLIDGIVQFIKSNTRLLQNVSKLIIAIEHRVGLSKYEYDKRIKEAIEKAIVITPVNKNIKFQIKIENKKDNMLQIADAIVHTFYRIDGNYYDESISKDTVGRFKEWIEPYKIYIHTRENITTKIMDLMNDGLYEYAIRDLINNHNDTRIDRIFPTVITQLCELSIFHLNSILLAVFSLYYNAINNERKLSNFENDLQFIIKKFLPAIEEELPNFDKRSDDIHWAYTYCYMILLTLYNHKGDVKKFEQAYNSAHLFFSATPFDIDSLSTRLRIRVLYGVHCTNMFQFDDCYKQMSVLEKKVTDAFAFLNESDENLKVQPRIVGEITGTKLQAMMYATLIRGGNWDEVRKQSDNAIKNFCYSEDLMRQYQYRAQIETYAKDYLQARNFLAKGCGVTYTNDEELLETIVKRVLIFPLLHFLRIYYVELMTNADNVKSYYEVITEIFSKNKSKIETIMLNTAYPMPGIFHYLMMIYGLFNSNKSFEEAGEFYRKACKLCKNDGNMTLKTIALSCHIDYIWLLHILQKKEHIKEIEKAYIKEWTNALEESRELPLYNYLCTAKERLDNTPLHQWNTLWYLFPF